MPFIDPPDRIPGLRAQARSDQPWYQFRNVAADEAELFLYDEIGGWGTLAEDFIAELAAVTSPKLRVRVSSPGGSVFEGIALANALRAHPADVTVQVDGIAASIASVIAMAGDRVVIQPQAMIMVHDASGVCLGNAQDMSDMAALLDKISGNIADAYASKAGGTRDEWRTQMRAESWFTAEEAVEAGLADEMLPARKQQAAPDEAEPAMRQFDLAAYGYQGPAKPETPKSAPEAAEPTLVISIADALDEDTMARLRAAVQSPAAEPVVEPEPVLEPEVPAEPEPAAELEPIEPAEPAEPSTQPEPADDWTAMVAALIPDDTDGWSALVSHLIEPDTSSSAATA
jgi:ATP-dependent protease ClpP protease subunit